jgi:SAM-dependent methyltransferase
MTGFSADWLALREPFDAAARAVAWPTLGPQIDAIRPPPTTGAPPAPLRVLDLACGTGANLRALAPRLGGAQVWQLVDHDPALLAALPQAMTRWADQRGYRLDIGHRDGTRLCAEGPGFRAELVTVCADLGRGLAGIAIGQPQLVTASALLDLVSAHWLENLIHDACDVGAAVLCALTVDGRTEWDPPDTADVAVHRLFALHQRRDKGFGPALGPSAGAHAGQCLAAAHYTVVQADSDWVIDAAGGQPHTPAMLAAMVDGMADAAIAQRPEAFGPVRAWQARRVALLGRTRLRVGHQDLMAVPTRLPGPDPTTGRSPSETP